MGIEPAATALTLPQRHRASGWETIKPGGDDKSSDAFFTLCPTTGGRCEGRGDKYKVGEHRETAGDHSPAARRGGGLIRPDRFR